MIIKKKKILKVKSNMKAKGWQSTSDVSCSTYLPIQELRRTFVRASQLRGDLEPPDYASSEAP